MSKSLLTLSVLLFSLLTSSQVQAVATYKWLDQNGSVHYTQHPPAEGIAYEKIQTIRPSKSSSGSTVKSSSAARDSILADKEKSDKNNLVEKEVAKNADTRKKNCELAKKQLNFYQVQRRWKDKDGNVKSMTDSERKAKLEESKQNIKDYCD